MIATRGRFAVALFATAPSALALGDEPKGGKIRIGLTDTFFRGNPEAREEKTTRSFVTLPQGSDRPGRRSRNRHQAGRHAPTAQGRQTASRHLSGLRVRLGASEGCRSQTADDRRLSAADRACPDRRRQGQCRRGFHGPQGKGAWRTRVEIANTVNYFSIVVVRPLKRRPKDFFAKILTPKSPEEAVDAVVNSQVDAALIDSVFLDWYEKNKAASFRASESDREVGGVSGPGGRDRAGGLDEATRDRLRKGMLSAKDNPRGKELMTLCQVTSFEAGAGGLRQTVDRNRQGLSGAWGNEGEEVS